MRAAQVERTYLELRTAAHFRGAALPAEAEVRREFPCAPATYRALYTGVGAAYEWNDRAGWDDAELAAHLARPAISVWVLHVDGAHAGFFELARHDDGSVEIAYFGLLGRVHGRGLGKALLTCAVDEAWRFGATRVWLHTCTLDSPAALPNYLARGFTPFRTERITALLRD